jgi:hypothetical protein
MGRMKNLGSVLILLSVLTLLIVLLPFLFADNAEDNPDIFNKAKDKIENEEATIINEEGVNENAKGESRTEAKIRFSGPGMESFSISGEAFLTRTDDIRLGKTIQYTVQISWKGKLGEIEVDEPDVPRFTNLKLKKVVPSNTISPETDRAITEFTYFLKPVRKGRAYIGIIDANYRLNDASGKGSFRLKERRFEVLPPRYNWGRIFLYILITVLSAGTIVGLVFLIIRFIKNQPQPLPSSDSETTTPYERILGELASMRLFLVEGEIRDFYSKLTKLAKGFVAVTEGKEIISLTTDELLHSLQDHDYNPENRDRIFTILEMCDRVKFAGYIPSQSENEQILKDFDILVRAELRK